MLPTLYHAHHSRYLEDIPFWLELAAQAGGPTLELGCGTGRVLIPLAMAGYRVFGLDNDLSMLRFLRGNMREGVKNTPGLIMADISRFNLSVRFPLILLPCNTYSMLKEHQRRACLGCVCRHLTNSGIFAVCIPNPISLCHLPSRSDADLEDEFIHPVTGNPVQVSSSWRRTKSTFDVTWIYDQLLPDGTVDRLEVKAVHLLTTLNTYMAEIEDAGLMVMESYGDFNRSAYMEESAYLILLIKRETY